MNWATLHESSSSSAPGKLYGCPYSEDKHEKPTDELDNYHGSPPTNFMVNQVMNKNTISPQINLIAFMSTPVPFFLTEP